MYINHSGGAKGADETWKELGKPHRVKTIDWRPHHVKAMSTEGYHNMLNAVKAAADALKRPHEFKGVELVHRNWFPAHHAQAIYAVSHIIAPGRTDFKGFENNTGKEIVAGGTGWAVEMAIQMGKPVYVFNMTTEFWYCWNQEWKVFAQLGEVPTLTEVFAGIGSRFLTPEGYFAIEDVYRKTFTCTT